MKKINLTATRVLSIVLSFLMIISTVSIPSFKSKAATGTVDDFVERCYTVTLGRGSDPDGFADWKGQLTGGKAVGVHVAYGFLFSAEYIGKNKSPEDYVTDLYMLFMGREPDKAGYQDWVGQLKSGKSRLEVFTGFANSQEFYNICDSYGITAGRWVNGYDRFQVNNVNLFVERLYKVCFGRLGDKEGQKNWVEKLLKKQITGSECARSFIQSTEYENLCLSDSEYVENLYIALMGRASDDEGKANWLNGLANGMTRDEVFAGFVGSVEFAGICNTYKIDRGSYIAKNKGTYDPDKQNNPDNDVTPKKHTGYRINGINMTESVTTMCYYGNTGYYSFENRLEKSKFEYTYSDKSKQFPVLIKKVNTEDGELEEKAQLEMNSKGLPVKKTVTDKDGKIIRTEEYSYNDKGQLTQVRIPVDGLVIEGITIKYKKMDFKYNSEGLLIQILNSSDDFYDNKSILEYDSEGKLIRSKHQTYNISEDKWSVIGIIDYNYSDSNRKVTLDGGIEGNYSIFEYNSRGDLIVQKDYSDGSLYSEKSYEYEQFDYYEGEKIYEINEFSNLGLFLTRF